MNKQFVGFAKCALISLVFLKPAYATIIKAYGSGNNTFYSFDPDTADLSLIAGQGSYAMDFAPDGTLYAVDRGSDALYQVNENGSRYKLTDLGYDDWGGGFTVTNNGQYAYWTNRTSSGTGSGYPTQLFRANLSGGSVESLGIIDGVFSVSDIEFGLDGTLYAISGVSHGCSSSAPDRALYTVNVNTMQSTKVSQDFLGMDIGCSPIITSLNATADGQMHMLVKPDGEYSYLMGTIDLNTGQGTIDYDKALTVNGSAQSGGMDIAMMSMVPVPPAILLFGSALGALGWVRRRKP